MDQRTALAAQVGFVRYTLALPLLRYHFSKIGPDGWKAIVEADEKGEEGDPYHDRAWRLFLEPFDLPEFRRPRITAAAQTDLRAAIQAARAPTWVKNLLTRRELKEVTSTHE